MVCGSIQAFFKIYLHIWTVGCASRRPEEMKMDFNVRETDYTCHYILLQYWGSSVVPWKWKKEENNVCSAEQRAASVCKMPNLWDDRINSNCVILLPTNVTVFVTQVCCFSAQIQCSFNSISFKVSVFYSAFLSKTRCYTCGIKKHTTLHPTALQLFCCNQIPTSYCSSLYCVFALCFYVCCSLSSHVSKLQR